MRSLGTTFKDIALRPTVPDHFFCPKCRYMRAPGTPDFQKWALETRPDLAGDSMAVMIRCRCLIDAEERKKRLQQNFMEANLPLRNDATGVRTFGNFEPVNGSEGMLNAASAFAGAEGPPVLTLAGETGCGKTHLMEAVGRAMLADGVTVRYERAGEYLDKLRSTFDSETNGGLGETADWYKTRHVLLLDDLGMHKRSDWGEGYLTSLVEQRIIDGARLIVATNLSPDEMAEAWGGRLASRLFDKASGTVKVVVCEAPDYRSGSA
jgi:DNA replication protein DnaC